MESLVIVMLRKAMQTIISQYNKQMTLVYLLPHHHPSSSSLTTVVALFFD